MVDHSLLMEMVIFISLLYGGCIPCRGQAKDNRDMTRNDERGYHIAGLQYALCRGGKYMWVITDPLRVI